MSWKLSIVSVVKIFDSNTENWFSESVELELSFVDVVLDSISILINNWSLLLSHLVLLIVFIIREIVVVDKPDRRTQLHSVEASSLLLQRVLALSLLLFVLELLNLLLRERILSWLVVISITLMAWVPTVASVVDVIDIRAKNWLSVPVKLILSFMDVVFDTVTISVNNWSIKNLDEDALLRNVSGLDESFALDLLGRD